MRSIDAFPHRLRVLALLAVVVSGSPALFAAPTITRQPANVTATAGQNATLTVAASGTGTLTYQWRRSGFDIAGATDGSLVIPSISRGKAGYYDVVVADSSGTVTSSVATLSVAPSAYPGTIAPDPTPVPIEGDENPTIYALAPAADGGFYAGGMFSRVNDSARSLVVRVNSDGSLDPSFVPPEFVGTSVKAVAEQSDGRVLVGGSFTHAGYYLRNALVRLNADGSVDTTFNPLTTGWSTVAAIVIQPDNKIVVAVGTTLVRLNPDGSLDRQLVSQLVGTPVVPGANPLSGTVNALALQSDGKLLVVGSISADVAGTTYAGAIRVNTDGTVDTTFQFPAYNGVLHAVTLAHDGHVYVAGGIFFGSTGNSILRLTSTGAIDASFTANTDGPLNAVVEQSDGRVIAGGVFNHANGVARTDLVRFNADGSVDTFVSTWPSSTVNAVLLTSTGDVVTGSQTIGTSFVRWGLARFSSTGVLQTTPNFTWRTYGLPGPVAMLPDGKFMVFGATSYAGTAHTNNVLRLNADGTLDTTFADNSNDTANAYLYPTAYGAVALPDGRVALAGPYSSGPGPAVGVRLVRADGSLDPSFNPAATPIGTGSAIALLPNGEIAVGGYGAFNSNLTYPGGVVVFKLDGTIDTSFATGTPFDHQVLTIAAQPDGRIVVGGPFTSFNSTPVPVIVRLKTDGTLDPTFNVSSTAKSAYRVTVLPSGQILADTDAGLLRLNADGSVDATFQPAVASVRGMLPQEDGKVIVYASPVGVNDLHVAVRLNADGSLDPTFKALSVTPSISGGAPLGWMRDDGQLLYLDAGTRLRNTTAAVAPVFSAAPQAKTVALGTSVTLTSAATSTIPVSYQWSLNGTAISGATAASYTVSNFGAANAGTYTVTATSDLGSATSPGVAVLAPADNRAHLINFSIRATAGTGDNRLIVGVVLGGSGTGGVKPLLFRGVGPTLTKYGVTGALPDPMLELYDATGTLIDQNDDWTGVFDFTSVGAFPFEGTAPKDAAIYDPYVANGAQTMHVIGKNGTTGVALAEVYDATPAGQYTVTTARFINGSARTVVGAGDNVLILGFVVGGQTNEHLLIRAVGPTLGAAPFNVGGVLADPKLEVYDSNNVKLAENDNWGDNGASAQMTAAFSAVGAFGLASPDSKDSALLITLPPGSYSAVVRGVGDTTGVALAELYETQ